MDKSYRIHTNITNDTVLNVNMQQDFDFLEVLSLKLAQQDAYRLHSSNYGVIVGRVLANDAFGIPNAKVSLFIERDTNDSIDIETLYPYSEITSRDKYGRRYNILPDYSDDDCYRIVGTFPNKRLMLDNDVVLEVYDKYWKYTTVTNQAGDYMLFGIPSGSQQIHVDIDLSDIGMLSQKPRDFEYKGYNLTMFDNPNQFKESTNLDGLAQLFSQNKSVFVYPFWGDADNGIAAITRSDIQIQYKFEPTCVFMGSIVSDNEGHAIGSKCAPDEENGMNDQLVAGQGTIEMIRKTTDGLVEEYQIQGNQLIDEDGVWCYQIPMNLDYVGTDEYGNIVPTDNPSKGIPTRTQVRFRFSKSETGNEGFSRHTAKYLVPMNPIFDENSAVPISLEAGSEVEKMYNFGSNTPQNCFRDLYWNNVYSVKNYIPKVQVSHRAYAPTYGALKGSNLATDQNPIPFNKLRVDLPFMYIAVCLIYEIVALVIYFINAFIICLIDKILSIINAIRNLCIKIWKFKICPFKPIIPKVPYIGCISIGGSALAENDNMAFYPGCFCSEGRDASDCPEDMGNTCEKSWNEAELMDRVQRNLALEFKIVKLDFYQDWINGCLYMPLWYWRKSKKKTFLFGLFSRSAKNDYCSCDKTYSRLKTHVTCNFVYNGNSLQLPNPNEGEDRWHRGGATQQVRYKRGLIKQVQNKDGLNVYYYVGMQPTTENINPDLELSKQAKGFRIIRLYATDIILLGNLNENNLYGIPQFFKALPSTTASIPPIGTVIDETSASDSIGGAAEGPSMTTGMDWGRKGDSDTPTYYKGLFMDLSCTIADTKAKSCINVERMCELGVSLDTSYTMPFSSNGDIITGEIAPDGFINKLELDDNDNRAMFATMNHIGFVPQDYQDVMEMYETQVYDKNTNYLIPKFRYTYPTDFDGRAQVPMNRYRKFFYQPMIDNYDDEYVTFRLGASSNGIYGRSRHFYYEWQMPVYNNSFYFYFGVNKGSTAIDKFNKMFYAECFQNSKKAFSIDATTQGKAYCDSIYSNPEKDAYGYIYIKLDDITIPYSYTLRDSRGNLIVEEDGMKVTEFVIGGNVDNNGNVTSNSDGYLYKQVPNESGVKEPIIEDGEPVYLENQMYTISITDGNGKTLSEKVLLNVNKIQVDYDSYSLGTKFYNEEETTMNYICDRNASLYGKIKINSFIVDGHLCSNFNYEVTSMATEVTIVKIIIPSSDDGIIVNAVINLYLTVSNINDDIDDAPTLNECMCNGNGTTVVGRFENNTFNIYQPTTFEMVAVEVCDGNELFENSTSNIITVDNGDTFNTYLNDMPLRFMLGSLKTENSNNFYNKNGYNNNNGYDKGWLSVHTEYIDSSTSQLYPYKFIKSTLGNQTIWDDFIPITGDISTPQMKQKVLEFKFNTMFKLSRGVYLDEYEATLTYSHTGGVEPVLERMVVPKYSSLDNLEELVSTYVYDDASSVTAANSYPNLVGGNYPYLTTDSVLHTTPTILTEPKLNSFWSGNTNILLGNYFASFTNNGGYISSKEIDSSITVEALPVNAYVNVYSADDKRKELGIKDEGTVTKFPKAYGTHPHLRGLFLDRRLDYNLLVLGPIVNEYNNITANSDITKTRLLGTVYGGIEMSYDADGNIISATCEYTDSDDNKTVSSATINEAVEYSYEFSSINKIYDDDGNFIPNGSDGDAVTIFNSNPINPRKFYKASFGDIDLIETSAFTKTLSGYPSTRRFDVCADSNITYKFNITSCSYEITTSLNDDGTITCKASPGGNISFNLRFGNDMIAPNGGGFIYGNGRVVSSNTAIVYDSNSTAYITMRFKYNSKNLSSSFESCTSRPMLLPMRSSHGNNIEYIKNGSDENDIMARVGEVAQFCPIEYLPEGVSTWAGPYNDYEFYYQDGEVMYSNDSTFQNIIFKAPEQYYPLGMEFTILTTRFYHEDDGSYLYKRIKSYEFGEIYKSENSSIRIIQGYDSGATYSTYVDEIHSYDTESFNQSITNVVGRQHLAFEVGGDLASRLANETVSATVTLTNLTTEYSWLRLCRKILTTTNYDSLSGVFEVTWHSSDGWDNYPAISMQTLSDWDDERIQFTVDLSTASGFNYTLMLNTFMGFNRVTGAVTDEFGRYTILNTYIKIVNI